MKSKFTPHVGEPADGDWSLVDLGDPIPKEATKFAHALGMNFEEFMYMVLEEKMQTLRDDKALMEAVKRVEWTPLLSEALEAMAKNPLGHPDRIIRHKKPLARAEDI
jgi:hypothetical protein